MGKWLKVKSYKPPVGERVQICYTRTAFNGRVDRIVTTGFYEDGNTLEDDSRWCCDTDWLYNTGARTDEKTGQYFIPKGWYEVLTSINGEYFCDLDRQTERVTHWQPLPALPGDKGNEKGLERLVTEHPDTNIEQMLNFAKEKNGRVVLSYAEGEEDYDLCEYISRLAKKMGCENNPEEIMTEGCCSECDCPVAMLNITAIQAAELRARLKVFEDGKFIPARFAHWIWRDSDCSNYEECTCSACGASFTVDCGNDNAPGKYCPECGALMCEGGSYEAAQ